VRFISKSEENLLRQRIEQQTRELRENQERIDRLVEAVARKDGGVSVQMPRLKLPEFDDKPPAEKGSGWFDQKCNPLPPGGTKPQ
jgi:hypothetical protein